MVIGGRRLAEPSEGTGGVTSGSIQKIGRDFNATDSRPLELESNDVCLRQMKNGDTRACLSHWREIWYPDLVVTLD
jgi:hypothetical protein